jgi:hypothetical protein
MTLGRAGGKTRRVKVHNDPAAILLPYTRPIRQIAVTGPATASPPCSSPTALNFQPVT